MVDDPKSEILQAAEDLRAPLETFASLHQLSPRERDVLAQLVNKVVSAEDISKNLGISRNTVRIHLKNINSKVGTNSKSELLGRFIECVVHHREAEERTRTPRLHILIADDDPDYVNLICKAAEATLGQNIHFTHAEDGHNLLEHLARTKRDDPDFPRPHLILLDLNMPKLNGFQALQKLKADPLLSAIPVIVFSASSSNLDISNIYALGGNSYVSKPLDYNELKKVIQGIVFYWGQIGALPNG